MIPLRFKGARPRGRGRTSRKAGEMNGWERRYAKRLEEQLAAGDIQAFAFEALKLRLAKKTFFDTDFLVVAHDGTIEIHEVKGHWEDDARVKFKVAAEMFPFRFFAVRPGVGPDGWVREEL